MYFALFTKSRPKNIEREPQFRNFLMFNDFRVSKTRVLASSFSVFRTRALTIIRKPRLFTHLAVKLVKKTAFAYVKYEVLAFPQIVKPRVLQCLKHIFHVKTQPNAAKHAFLHLKRPLNTWFGGPPRASRSSKSMIFIDFKLFWHLFGPLEGLKMIENNIQNSFGTLFLPKSA